MRHNQELLVGSTTTLDFTLRVSSVKQTVEVQGVAPDVETTENAVSDVLHTQQLDDLPILGRNFSEMASLTPGVGPPAKFPSASPWAARLPASR